MMNWQKFIYVACTLLTVLAVTPPALATDVKKLKWDDLVPKLMPLKGPVLELTDDQREHFDNISYFQSFNSDIISPEERTEYKEAKKAAHQSRGKLEKQGVKVDKFFERYEKWLAEVKRRKGLTVKEHHGIRISMVGYLLPLEFEPQGTKDFLLVPYVGACIHSPPPPENQTVFVHMKTAHKVKGLFDPVLVTGHMTTNRTSKQLNLVDGMDRIDAGYTLSGEKISKYDVPQ